MTGPWPARRRYLGPDGHVDCEWDRPPDQPGPEADVRHDERVTFPPILAPQAPVRGDDDARECRPDPVTGRCWPKCAACQRDAKACQTRSAPRVCAPVFSPTAAPLGISGGWTATDG